MLLFWGQGGLWAVCLRIKQPSKWKKTPKQKKLNTLAHSSLQNIKLVMVRKKLKPGSLLVFAVSKGSNVIKCHKEHTTQKDTSKPPALVSVVNNKN